MDLLKQLGTFVGWLSGVIAGITATLYALGFVASLAHQGMLGLDWAIIAREPLWYLGLGGQVAQYWAFLATVWLLLVLVVGESLLGCLHWAETREGPRARALRAGASWLDRQLIWFLALLSLVLAGFMMSAFDGALSVRNLLFASTAELCRPDGVIADLAAANREALARRAGNVAAFAALALGVCGYAVPRLMGKRGPALPLLICIAVGLQAIAAIPSAHGIFLIDARLRSFGTNVAIAGAEPGSAFYLLTRARDGLWVWEPTARKVHWVSDKSFDMLSIGRAVAIASLTCP
jgi:hypothetical protein